VNALLLAVALLAPEHALTTVAEASHYARTGRYDEVVRLCHDFARAYPTVSCETFGQSVERRPLLALSVGKKGAPTLVVQGGIHAGEIDGKDAGFLVLRELVDGKLDGVAGEKIRVVFVPVFNVDGHERFGAHNRPNQIGPAEMGWRTTAQNLNLNRDYVKAEAPEMRAMLALLQREDPIVYMDLHVTDGAQFQHDVAVLVEGIDAAALRARLGVALTRLGHLPLVDFYPNFVHHEDPASGFDASPSPPRFSQAYWAARNRIGILVETHSWKDYATRVRATHDTIVALLRELSAHGSDWQSAARLADHQPLGGRALALAQKADLSKPRTIDFLGYAYTRATSPVSTVTRITYDPKKPEVWRVPFYGEVVPTVTVTAPRAGWFVPRAFAAVVAEKLSLHGIAFRDLDGARTLAVDAFRADEIKRRPETFEARAMVTVRGHWSAESRAFAAGGIFIPVAQPRARLAAHLLEPEGPDSLTSWGYFDAVFEQKEYMEDYVLEAVAETMLQDPAVRAEWERRLKEPAFAKSPHERLDFFYRRHPSWDPQLDLVPVYRLQAAP
jgi:hypothetical protein